MKRRLRQITSLLLLFIILISIPACRKKSGEPVKELIDLGIPLLTRYSDETLETRLSRRSDDMIVYDGRLYVGCGDYTANTGPVPIFSMELEEREWHSDQAFEDEQIKRFEVINGSLWVPATDPMGNDWSKGGFYYMQDGKWTGCREIPSAIHCFDIEVYGGKTFFGLGVNSGDFPVAATADGETYESIPFVRDGVALDTTACEYVRTYNLSVFGGTLYAFLTLGNLDQLSYDVYVYDGEVFRYFSTPAEVFRRGYDLYHTAEFAGRNVFINGYCYFTTEDMVDFRPCRVGDSDLACDFEIIDGTLYVLAYRRLSDKKYEVGMYTSENGKDFEKRFYFDYEIPANSFAYADGIFYFSMGRYYDADSPEMGRVLAVEYLAK